MNLDTIAPPPDECLERDLIVKCLEKTGGNKRQAARLLNLSRTTFIDKLQRLNADGPPTAQTA